LEKEKNELFEWAKLITVTAIFIFVLRSFIFTPIVVDGHSMMPTYEDGDRVIVNKIGKKITDLKRFDIIVFVAPNGELFIKRIIGLPGDHIAYEDDVLYINGEKVDEPYLNAYKSQLTDQGDFTYDFTLEEVTGFEKIPKDYFFVLGDNRRNSSDSRNQSVGLVSMDQIVGEANIRVFPWGRIGLVK
jgi:signal peptidase I